MNKTNNYFERNQIVRNAQNYRYNFIDYLYYQGRRYEKGTRQVVPTGAWYCGIG